MRSEPTEDDPPRDEDETGNQPKIGCQLVVGLPEPDVSNETLPITLDDIVDGIEFDHVEILDRQNLRRPENRRHPEKELQNHADNLPHVAEKNDYRGGEPRKTQEQRNGTEEVIDDLQ